MSIASFLESKIASIPIPVVGETLISNYIQPEAGLIASTNDNINNIKNYYIDQYNKYIIDNNPIGIIGNVSYKFNVMLSPITPSTPYYSDIICQAAINKPLPEKIDYRTYLNEPRNQGPHGTCVAFASSAIVEFYTNVFNNDTNYVSPRYIYAHRDNVPREGMSLRDALETNRGSGSVNENDLPYSNISTSENFIHLERLRNKGHLKSMIYACSYISTVNELKISLANNGPCLLALPVFLDASGYGIMPNFWKAGTGNGDPKTSVGGHGVCVVGYDSTSFLLRNSWGTNVGNGGYFNFPFSDWGCKLECVTGLSKKPLPADIIYEYIPKNSPSETSDAWNKNWLYFLLIIPVIWIIIFIYYVNKSEEKYKNLDIQNNLSENNLSENNLSENNLSENNLDENNLDENNLSENNLSE